jgi:hypothetical protein
MATSAFAPGGLAARLGPRGRMILALSSIVFVFLGIIIWSSTRPVEIPTYYIVKWAGSGKCSVISERPEKGDYRLIWYSGLRESIDAKLKEFNRLKKCR